MPPSLASIYANPKTGLTFKRFWASAKSAGYSNKEAREFLEQESGETRFREKKPQFHIYRTRPRVKVGQRMHDSNWQIDLVDMTENYKTFNKGYQYILIVIDAYSRFLFARKLKTKSAPEVLRAFKEIVADSKHGLPLNIESDNGKEFKNKAFEAYLANVTVRWSPEDELLKGVLVERVNGTVRRLIGKAWEVNGDHVWVSILQDLVKNYNNSKHRTIKATPQSVYRGTVLPAVREDTVADGIHLGDAVRIRNNIKGDNLGFRKSNLPKWSKDIYGVVGKEGHRYALENETGAVLKKQYMGRDLLVVPYTEKVARGNRNEDRVRAKAAASAAAERERVTLRRKLRKAGLDPDEPVLPRQRSDKVRTRASHNISAGRSAGRSAGLKTKAPKKSQRYGEGDFVLVTLGKKNQIQHVAKVLDDSNQNGLVLREYTRIGDTERFKPAKHTPWKESYKKMSLVQKGVPRPPQKMGTRERAVTLPGVQVS